MACRLSTPSHYLNQCSLIVNWTLYLGTIFSKILIESRTFSLKKCVSKYSLRNIGHFVSASMLGSYYPLLVYMERGVFCWKWFGTNHRQVFDFNAPLTCSVMDEKYNLQCPKLKIHNRIYRNVSFFNTSSSISYNLRGMYHYIVNLSKLYVNFIIRYCHDAKFCDRLLDNNLSANGRHSDYSFIIVIVRICEYNMFIIIVIII